jgi:hypothetical protein
MKLALAALSLFLLLGTSHLAASPAPSAPEAATPAAVDPDADEAYCPMQWTCNFRSWYTSQATCAANCSGTCQLEYHCSPGCVCP